MNETPDKYDIQFYQLVLSLQAAAMQQMGKMASPLSGEVERDLNQARVSIDMLTMIQRKTEGNLSEDEKKLIDHVVYELRLNFVDESKKGDAEPEPAPPESGSDSDAPETDESESKPAE